jgi:hypothetical protein
VQNPEQREADNNKKVLKRFLVPIALAFGFGGALAGCAPEATATTTPNNTPDTPLPSNTVTTTSEEAAEPTETTPEFQATATAITQESVVKQFKEIESTLPSEQQAEFSQETQALIQELTEKQIIGPVQDPDNLVVDVLANGQPAVMLREYNDASGNILNQYFCVIRGENGFMVATLEGAQQFIKDQGLAGQATSLRFGNAGEPLILALDASGRIVAAVNGKSAGETAFQWVRADQAVAEYPESEVAINDAELPAGFPTELLSSLHRIETTPDGGQIAYGVGGTNNSEFILLFKAAGQTDWQSAPYGIGLPEDDESPGIIRRLSKDEQGNYSWGRIPVTEYGNIQEIAETGELLLESYLEEIEKQSSTEQFTALGGPETTMGLSINQEIAKQDYDKLLNAYMNSAYLKQINYWQENNIGPFNSVDEFKGWLSDHDWKLPKFIFPTGGPSTSNTGISGDKITIKTYSNVDLLNIPILLLEEEEYKQNIFKRALFNYIKGNSTFLGIPGVDANAAGFVVKNGKLLFICADIDSSELVIAQSDYIKQLFSGNDNDSLVADGWLNLSIAAIAKVNPLDGSGNGINVTFLDEIKGSYAHDEPIFTADPNTPLLFLQR